MEDKKDPGFLLGEIYQGQKNLNEKFDNLEKKIDNQISVCAARFIRDEKKVDKIENKVYAALGVFTLLVSSAWAKVMKLF